MKRPRPDSVPPYPGTRVLTGETAGHGTCDSVPDLRTTPSRSDCPSRDGVAGRPICRNTCLHHPVPVVPTPSRTRTNESVPRPPFYRGTGSVSDGVSRKTAYPTDLMDER